MRMFYFVLMGAVSSAYAGGVVGNGGDFVNCSPSSANGFSGIYSLDYVTNKLYQNKYSSEFDSVISKLDRFDKNILRLIEVTEVKFPRFSQSLKEFYDHLFSDDPGASYFWQKAPFGLPPINDEDLRIIIPPNCLGPDSKNPFFQAVIRNLNGNQVKFFYDPSPWDSVEPLQKSFLLLHEWLWNFTSDAESIRQANAILHAADWSLKTVNLRMQELRKTGLKLPLEEGVVGALMIDIYDDRMTVSFEGNPIVADAKQRSHIPTFRYPGHKAAIFLWNVVNHTNQYVYLQASTYSTRFGFKIDPQKDQRLDVTDALNFYIYLSQDSLTPWDYFSFPPSWAIERGPI